MNRQLLLLLATSTLMHALPAQEPESQTRASGPRPGTELPACPVYAPSGPFAGKELDAAAEIGEASGVLLFVHELSRNTAPMIGGLDRIAVEFAWTGLETHTIRIAADRTEAEASVKRSSDAMRLSRPILVSVDGVDGPGGYALDRGATLTLVTTKGGKVVRSVAFTDTGAADVPRLRELVEEVTGPVPQDPEALKAALDERLPRDPEQLRAIAARLALLLQQQQRTMQDRQQQDQQRRRDPMQGQQGQPQRPNAGAGVTEGSGRVREGSPPSDEPLRALLRRAIQQAADTTELDAVYAAVEARVGDDAGLRTQAVEMFKLQIGLGYGNDASRARAKAWIDANGGAGR